MSSIYNYYYECLAHLPSASMMRQSRGGPDSTTGPALSSAIFVPSFTLALKTTRASGRNVRESCLLKAGHQTTSYFHYSKIYVYVKCMFYMKISD